MDPNAQLPSACGLGQGLCQGLLSLTPGQYMRESCGTSVSKFRMRRAVGTGGWGALGSLPDPSPCTNVCLFVSIPMFVCFGCPNGSLSRQPPNVRRRSVGAERVSPACSSACGLGPASARRCTRLLFLFFNIYITVESHCLRAGRPKCFFNRFAKAKIFF